MPTLKAYKNNILCIEGDFGDKTTEAGIIIKSTIGSDEGILVYFDADSSTTGTAVVTVTYA